MEYSFLFARNAYLHVFVLLAHRYRSLLLLSFLLTFVLALELLPPYSSQDRKPKSEQEQKRPPSGSPAGGQLQLQRQPCLIVGVDDTVSNADAAAAPAVVRAHEHPQRVASVGGSAAKSREKLRSGRHERCEHPARRGAGEA